MSGFNSNRNGDYQKKKWETVITVVSLSFCAAGLAAISIISYFQTMYAFLPLNDTEIPVIGGYIAVGMAFIFQYGQNAALYYKHRYATGSHAFTFLLWHFTDKSICTGFFILCAVIDAGTNILWLQGQGNIGEREWYFRLLYYVTMIAVVFVEEVLGKAIQIVAHAYTELQKILVAETGRRPEGRSGGEGEQKHQMPKHAGGHYAGERRDTKPDSEAFRKVQELQRLGKRNGDLEQ